MSERKRNKCISQTFRLMFTQNPWQSKIDSI
jgi:hypothetical protein